MFKVLVIDDDPSMRETLADLIHDMNHNPVEAETLAQGMEMVEKELPDLVLLDVVMPDGSGLDYLPRIASGASKPEVIVITGADDPKAVDTAVKNGAWDYIKKQGTLLDTQLPIKRALQYRKEKIARENKDPLSFLSKGIICKSPLFRSALEKAAKAASGDVGVLITGETGTGKELTARIVHDNSKRVNKAFVVVDCAALPENLVENELFGHIKGSYTGAEKDHPGLIAEADGGTLFLDEIGELPMQVQKSFLRVLQEQRYRPVGGNEKKCDFRVISATNRNLEEMADRGLFRRDLLYRINVVHVHLPPLRERKEEIRPFTEYTIEQYCKHNHVSDKEPTPEFYQTLKAYDWPGNVRELKNTLESILVLSQDAETLFPQHLPDHIRLHAMKATSGDHPAGPSEYPDAEQIAATGSLPTWKEYRERAVIRAEREYFTNLLAYTNNDALKAMVVSDLSRARFYKLVKKVKNDVAGYGEEDM